MEPGESAVAGTSTYRSRFHPRGASRRAYFASALARPLAACVLPLMVGALIAVLQGLPALRFATVGLPLAFALAALWTAHGLWTTPAELHLRPGAAALRTVWDCFRPRPALQWKPILELRTLPHGLVVALGDGVYRLDHADWPCSKEIQRDLVEARGY